jgi:hypothetical protein
VATRNHRSIADRPHSGSEAKGLGEGVNSYTEIAAGVAFRFTGAPSLEEPRRDYVSLFLLTWSVGRAACERPEVNVYK